METLVDWLPRVGALLTVLFGLVGFFNPRQITDAQQIELRSAMAHSEARVVFGGLHLGGGIMALVLHEPMVYVTLGAAWGCGVLARFYSMLVDKATVRQSVPGITIDVVMASLFLSVLVN